MINVGDYVKVDDYEYGTVVYKDICMLPYEDYILGVEVVEGDHIVLIWVDESRCQFIR